MDLINEGRCSVVAEFCRRVQAVIWNRSLMRTKAGHLGMVRRDAQTRDLLCILYGCSVPVVLREHKKSPETVAREQKEDEEELEQKRVAAAVHIQRAFRESKERKEKQRQKQAASGINGPVNGISDGYENGNPSVAVNGEVPPSPRKLRIKKPVVKPKPDHLDSSPLERSTSNESSAEKDEDFWYEFIGECYVHGMMDGEAIKFQNDNRQNDPRVRPRLFELR
jgi:hypothetical protein